VLCLIWLLIRAMQLIINVSNSGVAPISCICYLSQTLYKLFFYISFFQTSNKSFSPYVSLVSFLFLVYLFIFHILCHLFVY
jgi:hypothetical protein